MGSSKKPRPTESKIWNPTEPSAREFGDAHAERLAQEIGFLLNPGSGSVPNATYKADGRDGTRRYEVKATAKPRFTIDENLLGKLLQDCRGTGDDPILLVTLGEVRSDLPRDWAIMPKNVFIRLLESKG